MPRARLARRVSADTYNRRLAWKMGVCSGIPLCCVGYFVEHQVELDAWLYRGSPRDGSIWALEYYGKDSRAVGYYRCPACREENWVAKTSNCPKAGCRCIAEMEKC